jgi:hypothetical protein
MKGAQFKYVIKFVADMNNAVKFYRDSLDLQLKFESPGWSEFVTGETTQHCNRLPKRTRLERLNWGSQSPTWRLSTGI